MSLYARTAAGSGQTARMDRWSWKPHLKVMTMVAIAAGYVSLVLSLFGVWRTL